MMIAIHLAPAGGPEVLLPREAEVGAPGPNEAILSHRPVNLNVLGAMQRKGALPISVPDGIGLKGTVTSIGRGVTNVAVGHRAAFALKRIGACAGGRADPADRSIYQPEALGFEEVAAVTFEGVTAQHLIFGSVPPGAVAGRAGDPAGA